MSNKFDTAKIKVIFVNPNKNKLFFFNPIYYLAIKLQIMTVKQRHKAVDKRLKKAAEKIINAPNTRAKVKPIAEKHGVSGQTILNYIYGMGSDGFLKEALIADLS